MDLLRISLVQYDVVWESPVSNRKKLDLLLEPLQGITDVVLLPEMFTTGFSMNAGELAESMSDETVGWMKTKAAFLGAALAGSLIIRENNHCFNRFLFVTPSGEITTYDKKHLFSMGAENQYFTGGSEQVILDYLGWRIAPFICYDLRFPVWCRTGLGADLMLFTANWPDARKNVWQILTKARALENQVYVAAVNRTGTDGSGIFYSGESRLVDPKGNLLVDLENTADCIRTFTVSKSELDRFRKKFPVWKDRDSFEILG